jgi:hypothetical protein
MGYLYQNQVKEFDLTDTKNSEEVPAQVETVFPLVASKDYSIIDVVKVLRKAPDVKRALNKDWAMGGRPGEKNKNKGAGSIFDDFFDGGSDSSSEEKEEVKKEAITVDDGKVLEMSLL